MSVLRSPAVEWAVASAAFAVAVPVFAFTAFIGALFTPGLLLYDFAFWVVPTVCPIDATWGECYAAGGWAKTWSYPLWALLAIAFGGATRGRRLRTKAAVAVATIVVTTLVVRLLIHLLGLRVFIDTI